MSTRFFGVTTRFYEYTHSIGRGEFSGRGFRVPMDLALAKGGKIYVANRSWEYRPDGVRVTMCTIDEEYLGEFGRFGRGRGQFVWPSSIALDSNGNVYVADDYLHRIQMFNGAGEFQTMWGTQGSGDGQLDKPSGMAFDKDDNLYVVDSGNCRVQAFTKEGKFLSKWGRQGHGEGEFNLPWGVTIDVDGNVWVADWRNDRIQKFTADGQFLASFGESGSEVGQFNRPTGVAVDVDGDFYVADWANDRVQVFEPDGRFITALPGESEVSKWGEEKLQANPDMIRQRNLVRDLGPEKRFWRPVAVKVDEQRRVIVSDCNRARLQVYQKSS